MKFLITSLLAGFLSTTLFAAVYEIQMNVTTTTPQEAKLKASSNYCEEEGSVAYRRVSKMKIRALVWGAGCEAAEGFAIWNETLKVQYASDSEFAFEFLNRIGKAGTEAEGLWVANLNYVEGDQAAYLYGAGTGKIKGENEISINGNFAGWMNAGLLVKVEKTPGCTACGGGIAVTVLDALGWGICDCAQADERTAAHGNWTMKYNAAATKKYDETGDISVAYKFPSYVEP